MRINWKRVALYVAQWKSTGDFLAYRLLLSVMRTSV